MFSFGSFMIELVFPDGSKEKFKNGITGLDIAKKIGARLAKDALAVQLNGQTLELDRAIEEDGDFRILTWNDLPGKQALWHTGSHVLAEAVTALFPNAKPSLGPPIEDGFYYDFDVEKSFSEEDLQKIEKKMKEIVKRNEHLKRHEVPKKEAIEKFKNNPYKVEMINEYAQEGQTLSIYSQGKFFDLCRGGHVSETGKLKGIKVLKSGGSYWRGDEKNKMLQRVYAIAFPEEKLLEEFLKRKEEAGKRDHRKLGQELDLFWFHEYSPGSPFFLPSGTAIYNELAEFIRSEYRKRGFQEVVTPQLFNKKLWETSGHWEHYRENMFVLDIDGEEFALKSMNCPSHVLIYQRERHSYRDLPLRIADFGVLHRNELKGVLGGLTRVRKFAQDDSHTFCAEEQVEKEIFDLLGFAKFIFVDTLGMSFQAVLSTRPKEFMGVRELWDKAEESLKKSLKEKGFPFEIAEGEGAFYGPKIDLFIKDALGRGWQLTTIQLDFQMPRRFGLEFIDQNDKPQVPVMIHKALLGSLERCIGILTEHFAGKFPLWLSPVQVAVLSITDRNADFAIKTRMRLIESDIRVKVDTSNETLSYKIRQAQLQKIPFILVIGDKEMRAKNVNVRTRDGNVLGSKNLETFIEEVKEQIKARK